MYEIVALEISEKRNVYNIVKELNLDDATNASALLIDQKYEHSLFSDEINEIVTRVTKIVNFNFINTVENDYEDYRNLVVMMANDYRVLLLAIAYRLNFMRKYKKLEIENRYDIGNRTLLVYAPLAHRLGLGAIKTELEELALYYMDPVTFKEIAKQVKLKKHERDKILEDTLKNIIALIPPEIQNFKISGRNKSIYSIYNKLKTKELSDLYDLQGIRIICNDISECYAILGIIHGAYQPVAGRFKDYIAVKKPNLYQSLHSTIISDKNVTVEIQIRTFEMDEIAEKGIAAHFLYKEGYNGDLNDIEEQIHIFRDVITNQIELSEEHTAFFESCIYTFTPNGKIISLPKNATAIDFAYQIHSSVAESMVNAIVNGVIRPIDSILENGDVISINTRKNVITCNENWLEACATTYAKKKIKACIKHKFIKENEVKIDNGKNILKELERRKLIPEINDAALLKLQRNKGLSSVAELYISVNDKKYSVELINDILEPKDNRPKFVTKNVEVASLEEIIISGAEGIKKEIAKCCNPVPGDDIVGVINSGKNIKIHRASCHNVKDIDNKLDATWNDNINETYVAKFEIHSLNSETLMNNIITVFSKEKVVMQSFNTTIYNDQAISNITFGIKNKLDLRKIKEKIEELSDVIYVVR